MEIILIGVSTFDGKKEIRNCVERETTVSSRSKLVRLRMPPKMAGNVIPKPAFNSRNEESKVLIVTFEFDTDDELMLRKPETTHVTNESELVAATAKESVRVSAPHG